MMKKRSLATSPLNRGLRVCSSFMALILIEMDQSPWHHIAFLIVHSWQLFASTQNTTTGADRKWTVVQDFQDVFFLILNFSR